MRDLKPRERISHPFQESPIAERLEIKVLFPDVFATEVSRSKLWGLENPDT